MTLKLRHFYEFGPFHLEPDEQLLLSGDQPVAIAPKSFEVLVFLVQNHGRLVTKDQIMQAIWSGSFVEEANLTVAISAIRKALGEKESNFQYIETVPKRGYRFTAPVREVQEAPTHTVTMAADSPLPGLKESTAGEAAGTPPAALDLDPKVKEQTELDLAHFSGPRKAIAAFPEAARALDRRGEVPRLRAMESRRGAAWRVRIAAALLVIPGVAIFAGYVLRTRPTMLQRPSAARRSLAILPFQSLKQDPDNDFLGFSLADAVITKLDYVSSLTVRPSVAVQKYRNQMIEIPRVARELNVDTLLIGRFLREGDDLRITYQLIDVKTEKILGQDSMDLKYDKLLRVQDSVAQRVIQGLELNLSASEAERIKPEELVSPRAYEYYLRGVDLHGRHEFPLAIKMLEKSAAIDPRYALTWAYLGASYTSDAAFELEGRKQYRKAQAAYERALALQPTQLEAHIFLANLLVDTGRVEQAIPLLREALQTNPNHADTHWELGYAYRFAGMLEESVAECERARQLDPLVKANGSVLNTYLYLAEYDKFLESLPDENDSAFVLFYRGFGAYYRKNWQRAAQDFDRAYALDPSLYAQIGKAFSESIAHQDADGLALLHSLENKIAERGVGDPEAFYKIAQAYAALGDKTSTLRVLRQSVESGFFCYPYISSDPLLNTVRGEAGFEQLVNLARQRHQAFRKKFFTN
jgi:DNA-binding winged helix-turn-helix (wHTH) protein/TolB-like protein